ncbi:DUF1642 domain-containing protein [Streptococcus parasuis]|uniref:DUF1642 domain-containing protein n=1 Tax=Streptococcus parasuis TaxID=1501662 RepID=UPI0025A51DE4|nr:DUF1642 domain-containing protein [Streptococcus parasuis]WJQ86116.1 DUF1642 domain-containing protein [Streptococcus parasuis]
MNKQEAIELLRDVAQRVFYRTGSRAVHIDKIVELVNQIDEPQKPKVSQVAVEFYEKYKADMLSLDEWFSDFYSNEAIEDFPRMEELTEWLHGNDNETNRQRELALATLVTLGIDAVEVEKEKLYTVEIPNPALDNLEFVIVLKRIRGRVCLVNTYDYMGRELSDEYKLTEAEIKKDFDFLWRFAKEVE